MYSSPEVNVATVCTGREVLQVPDIMNSWEGVGESTMRAIHPGDAAMTVGS